MTMKRTIYRIPQHKIMWEKAGMTHEEFVAKYNVADDYTQRTMLESLPIWTNPEWLALRAGRFGCSKAAEFLAEPVTKAAKEAGEMGETAKKLAYRVIAEHDTNWREPEPGWNEKVSIKRGLIFEPIARRLAEAQLGDEIEEIGIITYGDYFGYSPDGIVKDDPETGIEIKTYEPTHFIETIMNAGDKKVQLQMQAQMWTGGLKRVYLVLYCPEIDPKHVVILKYTRGLKYQAALERRAGQMIDYMDKVREQIAKREIVIETAGE